MILDALVKGESWSAVLPKFICYEDSSLAWQSTGTKLDEFCDINTEWPRRERGE